MCVVPIGVPSVIVHRLAWLPCLALQRPSIEELIAEAQREIGEEPPQRLSEEQVRELCKFTPYQA